jgi:hypothetical protein
MKVLLESSTPFLISNVEIRLAYDDVDPISQGQLHQSVELLSIRPSKYANKKLERRE